MNNSIDGSVNIDVLFDKTQIKSDADSVKQIINGIGEGAGDKLGDSFAKGADKVKQSATEASQHVKSELGTTTKPKIDDSDINKTKQTATNAGKKIKDELGSTTKPKTDDSELNKTKEDASKAGNEIKKLKSPISVRIKDNLSEFNEHIGNAHQKINNLREETTRLKGAFGGAFGGAFLGNLASSAFESIKEKVGEATHAVIAYNNEQQVMQATWHTLTGSAQEGQGMVDMVNNLSTSLGQDVGVTDELAEQFYHVYNNKDKTEQLTKSMLTMGDAIGMGGDRLKQVGLDLTHTLSSGKMQLGDFNQISDAFPMFGEKLLDYERKVQHSSNLSMSTLRDQMSAGKISAQDAANVINELGEKYKDSADNLMQTLPGMYRKLQSQLPKLMNDMVSPILSARNPIVAQVSAWSSDPKTESEFKKLGTKVSSAMTDVSKQFSKSLGSGNISDFLDKGIDKFGDFITNGLHWLAGHADSIIKIFKSLGSISKNLTIGYINTLGSVFKLFGASGDGITAVANGMANIAKHKKAVQIIGGVLATMWATSKIDRYIGRVGALVGAFKDVGGAIGGLFGKAGAESTATKVIGAEKSAPIIPMGEKAGGATNLPMAVGKAGTGSKMLALGKSIGSKLATGAMFAFNAVDIFQGLNSKSKSTRFEQTGRGIGGAIGGGIGMAFGPIGAMIGETLGSAIGQIAGKCAKKFSDGWDAWNSQNKPKGLIAKVGFDTHQAMHTWNNNIAEIEKKHPRLAVAIRFEKGLTALWSEQYKGLARLTKNGFGDLGDIAKDVFMGRFDKIVPDVKKNFNELVKGLKNDWNDIVNAFTKNNKKEKKPTKKSSSSKKKTTTKEAITKVATTHVSKTDIANVKAMIPAMKAYQNALKNLKSVVKKNNVNKEISSLNSSIKSGKKVWSGANKPLDRLAKSFKTLMNFNVKTAKKDGFNALNKDLKSLDKTLKKSKVDSRLNSMARALKKNKLASELSKIDKSVKSSTRDWKKLASPIASSAKAFDKLVTASNRFKKQNVFGKLNRDYKTTYRTLKKYDVGGILNTQIKKANRATRGAKFANQFSTQIRVLNQDVRGFKKSFGNTWSDTWDNARSKEQVKTKQIRNSFSSFVSELISKETSMNNKFLNQWSSWLSSVKSSFKSTFSSIVKTAGSAMSDVVGRINKGIGGVNTVIGEFGGKKLGLAKYAIGTSGTMNGGLAVVGEQGYELAQDAKHGIYPIGLGGEEIRHLEPDTSIMPHAMSTQFMSMVAGLPHHKDGKGNAKDDMMSYLIDHYDQLQKDPLPLLKKEYYASTDFKGSEFTNRFGTALSNGFLKSIAVPFKKQLSEMSFSMGGNYDPKMIKAAALMMHADISDSYIKMLQAVIQSESGGRNVIQQIHDMNSGGNEARGILQYTPPTFGYYAVNGHKNIMNPFDQLLAFFNNSDYKNAIGPTSIWGVSKIDWLHSGPQGHRRMADGGWIDEPTMFKNNIIGEAYGEPEVVINPKRDTSDALIMQVMKKRIESQPNGRLARAMNGIDSTSIHTFSSNQPRNTNVSTHGITGRVNESGNISVNTLLDSGQIASATYPIYKAKQAKEINILAKKGGLH